MTKDHFYFSRNDRIVALVLLCIIIVSKIMLVRIQPDKIYNTDNAVDSLLNVKEEIKPVDQTDYRRVYIKDNTYHKSASANSSNRNYNNQGKNRPVDLADRVSRDTVMVKRHYSPKQSPSSPLDLNNADSLALISLPGIGPYYSSRILRYREQLGGYVRISQLCEINGLPDSVMKWFVLADTVNVRPLPVNEMTLSELRKHPYMNFYQARSIVEFRRERGKIRNPEQLSMMEEFTTQDIERLLPYIDFR